MIMLSEKQQHASSKIAFDESSIIQELLRDLELIKELGKSPGGKIGFTDADSGFPEEEVDSTITSIQICITDPLQSVNQLKKLETPTTTKASTDNSTTLNHHLHEDIIVPTHSNTSLHHQQGLHPGSQHAKQNFQEIHLSSYENMIQNTSEKVVWYSHNLH